MAAVELPEEYDYEVRGKPLCFRKNKKRINMFLVLEEEMKIDMEKIIRLYLQTPPCCQT